MSFRRRCHVTVLLGLLSVGLPALELAIADIEFGAAWRSTDFDFTITDTGTAGAEPVSGSDDFAWGTGTRLRALWSWSKPGWRGGFLFGGELNGSWFRSANDSDLMIVSLNATGGYGISVSSRVESYALVGAGYGIGRFTLDGGGRFDDFSADGPVMEYNATLGAQWRLSHRWRLSAEVGWRATEGDFSGGGFDFDIEQSGPTAFLGLGFRIDPRPPRLE